MYEKIPFILFFLRFIRVIRATDRNVFLLSFVSINRIFGAQFFKFSSFFPLYPNNTLSSLPSFFLPVSDIKLLRNNVVVHTFFIFSYHEDISPPIPIIRVIRKEFFLLSLQRYSDLDNTSVFLSLILSSLGLHKH